MCLHFSFNRNQNKKLTFAAEVFSSYKLAYNYGIIRRLLKIAVKVTGTGIWNVVK